MVGVSKVFWQIIKRGQRDDHLINLGVKWFSIIIYGNLNIDLLTVISNYASSFYLWQIYCALLLSRVICCAHSGYIAFQLLQAEFWSSSHLYAADEYWWHFFFFNFHSRPFHNNTFFGNSYCPDWILGPIESNVRKCVLPDYASFP